MKDTELLPAQPTSPGEIVTLAPETGAPVV
jgi:hypothetical protein